MLTLIKYVFDFYVTKSRLSAFSYWNFIYNQKMYLYFWYEADFSNYSNLQLWWFWPAAPIDQIKNGYFLMPLDCWNLPYNQSLQSIKVFFDFRFRQWTKADIRTERKNGFECISLDKRDSRWETQPDSANTNSTIFQSWFFFFESWKNIRE